MRNIITKFKKAYGSLINDEAGSAIILALIIMAGLAGTGIGAARLAPSNTEQTTLFEDSLKAYYAAEAGVEMALLEWRFNHDVELWDADMARTCYADPVANADECEGATISKAVLLQDDMNDPIKDITEQIFDPNTHLRKDDATEPVNQAWYEIKVSYRDPEVPKVGDYNNPENVLANTVLIEKDETYEFGFLESDNIRSFKFRWYPNYGQWPGDEVVLTWHPVAEKGGVDELVDDPINWSLRERQYFSDDFKSGSYYSEDKTLNLPLEYNGLKSIRLKAIVKSVEDYSVDGRLKGVYMSAQARDAGNQLVHLPKDEITLVIIGHYNILQRGVEYIIDRQSGTINSIFDYGVFSNTSLSK